MQGMKGLETGVERGSVRGKDRLRDPLWLQCLGPEPYLLSLPPQLKLNKRLLTSDVFTVQVLPVVGAPPRLELVP